MAIFKFMIQLIKLALTRLGPLSSAHQLVTLLSTILFNIIKLILKV